MNFYNRKVISIVVLLLLTTGLIIINQKYFNSRNATTVPEALRTDSSPQAMDSENSFVLPMMVAFGSVQPPKEPIQLNLLQPEKSGQLIKKMKLSDMASGAIFSPNRKYLVYWRWNDAKDGYICLYCSAKAEMVLMSLDEPYNEIVLSKSGKEAFSYLSWSPDGQRLLYSVNDGEAIEVRNIADNTTWRIKASGSAQDGTVTGSAGVWLDDNTISYIKAGTVYMADVTTKKSTVITSGALSNTETFEGPNVLFAPEWSPDRQMVVFESADSLTIFNVITKKVIKLGHRFSGCADQGDGGLPGLTVIGKGWTNDNRYFYVDSLSTKCTWADNGKLFSVNADDDRIEYSFEVPGNFQYSVIVSPDGKYMTWSDTSDGAARSFFFSLDSQKQICPYVESMGTLDIRQPWSTISSGKVLVKERSGAEHNVLLVDLVTCTVPTHWNNAFSEIYVGPF